MIQEVRLWDDGLVQVFRSGADPLDPSSGWYDEIRTDVLEEADDETEFVYGTSTGGRPTLRPVSREEFQEWDPEA